MARGETANDVDLIAEFDESRRLTLLDMVKFERDLSAIDLPLRSTLLTENR